MTAICARRRIIQYESTASNENEQNEINPVGTLAGSATFATPLKNAADRKMRRKNWMTSRAENVGSSLEEETPVQGQAAAAAEGGEEGVEEAEESEAPHRPNGEAVVKELSEAGLAPALPPDGSVNGDEGYAEDDVDNAECDDGEHNIGAVFQLYISHCTRALHQNWFRFRAEY